MNIIDVYIFIYKYIDRYNGLYVWRWSNLIWCQLWTISKHGKIVEIEMCAFRVKYYPSISYFWND